jgi:hypothetical protein
MYVNTFILVVIGLAVGRRERISEKKKFSMVLFEKRYLLMQCFGLFSTPSLGFLEK